MIGTEEDGAGFVREESHHRADAVDLLLPACGDGEADVGKTHEAEGTGDAEWGAALKLGPYAARFLRLP